MIKLINSSFLEKEIYNPNESYLINCQNFDENELNTILEFQITNQIKNNFVLYYQPESFEKGRWSMVVANRLKIPILLNIQDKNIFLKLFEFWIKTERMEIPVFPFNSIISLYISLIAQQRNHLIKNNYIAYSIFNLPINYIIDSIHFIKSSTEIENFLSFIKSETSINFINTIENYIYSTGESLILDKKSIFHFISINNEKDFFKLHDTKISINSMFNIIICNVNKEQEYYECYECNKCNNLNEIYNYITYNNTDFCGPHKDKNNFIFYNSLKNQINHLLNKF